MQSNALERSMKAAPAFSPPSAPPSRDSGPSPPFISCRLGGGDHVQPRHCILFMGSMIQLDTHRGVKRQKKSAWV